MTIDLTDVFAEDRFMRGGLSAWTIDRGEFPVRYAAVHHTAGWYIRKLDWRASQTQEEQELAACARDHYNRFGVGPGYHYAGFPSGRLYAIGKWGTRRAHTAGRNPATGNKWNLDSIGLVAWGDYHAEFPGFRLRDAIVEGLEEISSIAAVADLRVLGHREHPTIGWDQTTSCPGDRLLPFVNIFDRLL